MSRKAAGAVGCVLVGLLVVVVVPGVIRGPGLIREASTVIGPVKELASSEEALRALDQEIAFAPAEGGAIAEERLARGVRSGAVDDALAQAVACGWAAAHDMDDAEEGLARQRPRVVRGARTWLAALLPLLLTACASQRERPVWFCPDVLGDVPAEGT